MQDDYFTLMQRLAPDLAQEIERRALVLCVNKDGTRDRAPERLYVGLSRATDRLIVVGDPDAITRMGGPEVSRRLLPSTA